MSENPDLAAERERNRIIFNDSLDRHFPTYGDLRFVTRDIHNKTNEFVKTANTLQRYEYSQELGHADWFDVPVSSEAHKGDTDE